MTILIGRFFLNHYSSHKTFYLSLCNNKYYVIAIYSPNFNFATQETIIDSSILMKLSSKVKSSIFSILLCFSDCRSWYIYQRIGPFFLPSWNAFFKSLEQAKGLFTVQFLARFSIIIVDTSRNIDIAWSILPAIR